ncbi:hypothetical protein AJ79_01168 [Helicocarpus griseus UAMH5409]|uniref:C2H2-type domain-containing protein n=1 Tax=Helicocarpus griseus UAMH5409 TaxID=1447875 RepID=A0A2B7Y7S8_9EURO|nr:hypothetical protein AJ79_01168 [Helicocarpus griseus UAMH5409]
MASFKDSSSSRPISHATPPLRQSNGRHHSHSVSLGAVNVNHRVTRRKSMTSTAATNAAAAAAVAAVLGESPNTSALSSSAHHRRGLSSRRAVESTSMGASSGFGSYLARTAGQDGVPGRKNSPNSIDENTAVEDNSSRVNGSGAGGGSNSNNGGKAVSTKQRSRRASEGSHLIRSEGKRVMNELRCDRCGKGYKHSSCLTKHMWEHDPAWAYTSKLLISKHQQVQLLEAATVLVNMNPETDQQQPTTGESDRSSASPTASGISELRDGVSSTETTPPPMGEDGGFSVKPGDHRFSANSFSRSFQSIPSSSFTGSAPTFSPAHSHFRQSSIDTRPSTAETGGLLDDDEAGLAAAIELCHFGTPRSGPIPMSPDIPPVPPLPARFLGQSMGSNHAPVMGTSVASNNTHSFDVLASAARQEASSTPTIYNLLMVNPSLSYKVSDVRDVKMDDAQLDNSKAKSKSHIAEEDDDFAHDHSSVVPMDDDDDGVFGRMEE